MTETATATLLSQDGSAQPATDVAQAQAPGRLPDAPLSMPTQRLLRDRREASALRAIIFGPLGPAGT